MKRRMIAIAFSVVACMALYAPAAFALTVDSAGSSLVSSEDIEAETIESDIYWLGTSVYIVDSEVGGDIIGAGFEEITVDSSKVLGNIRVAADEVTINYSEVSGNITAAASSYLQIGEGTSANGVYIFGDEVAFYGTADYLAIYGTDVTVDGTVDGDVVVYADTVTVGGSAVVSGEFTVYSSEEPDVSDNAQATVDWTLTYSSDASIFSSSAFGLMSTLMVIVLALIFAFALSRQLDSSIRMYQEGPGKFILAGVLVVLLAPVVAIILLVFMVTAPIGLALIFAILMLTCVALPFTAAAVGKMVFKNMNKALSALIMGAILGLLSMVSILGLIIAFCSAVYIAGYAFKSLFSRRKVDAGTNQPAPPYGSGGGYGGGRQDPYAQNGYGQGYGQNYGQGYDGSYNQGYDQGYGQGYDGSYNQGYGQGYDGSYNQPQDPYSGSGQDDYRNNGGRGY